jgi:predicted 3-demethylubiquinone-9 3-methyltransferase (glyoxalase superfamily)
MATANPTHFGTRKATAASVATLLLFDGTAEEAMNFYVSLFSRSEITAVEKYGAGDAWKEGAIKRGSFHLKGHQLICIDSPFKQKLSGSSRISIFVDCEDEAEIEQAYELLTANGTILMPLGNYGFSKKFAWVSDRFGVSWHLNLR